MAYATAQDVIDELGVKAAAQLSTPSSSTVPDTSVIERKIVDAQGEIDSYLSRRYAVPVNVGTDATLRARLRGAVVDLAVHRLYSVDAVMPEAIENKRKAVIGWLKDVAMGKADLPSVSELAAPTTSGPHVEVSGPPGVFGRDRTGGLL